VSFSLTWVYPSAHRLGRLRFLQVLRHGITLLVRACFIALCLSQHIAVADTRINHVWQTGTFELPDAAASCAAYCGDIASIRLNLCGTPEFTSVTSISQGVTPEHPVNSRASCQCVGVPTRTNIVDDEPVCRAEGEPRTFTSRDSVHRHRDAPHNHDEEEDMCRPLEGAEITLYPKGPFDVDTCFGGCEYTQSTNSVSILIGDQGGVVNLTGTGLSCASNGSSSPQTEPYTEPSDDPSTNTLVDPVAGTETDYPAPPPPPPDAAPTDSATGPDGTTLELYAQEGGGNIYVITDSDGNVTFTDLSPISGSGQYALSPDSGGSTTGGTDPGGTTSGDTGSNGGTTGGDPNTGGTDTGTGEGGEGEEEEPRSSSGGDTCASEPQCSGDAINCAIVLQNWHQRCTGTDFNEQTAIDNSNLSEFTVAAIDDGEIGIGDFDDSGFLGGAATCPAAESINVLGQSFTIPYDPLCDIGVILGYFVLITASLHSSRVVIGAF